MLWGLLDAHFYCGNRQALFHLGRITDWAIKNLDRSRRVNDTATEWYTLSENLYRAPTAQVLRDVDLTSLEQVLTPVAGEPLHYRLARNPSVVARPFASFGADRRYFVYLDPEMGRRIPRAIVLSTGGDV